MHIRLVKTLLATLMVFALGACSQGRAIEPGEDAPDFSLNDLNGKAANLSDFKGKVIILDFFASWCPPCREEIPDFIKLQNEYGPQGFTVIGVAMVSLDDAKAFASKMGINYPVLIDDEKSSAAYGPIRSIPTTFVIGKEFKVMKKYIGFRSKDIFEGDVKELLK